MSDRTVSVIIPTHNRAHLLPRALASVLSQDYEPMEIIIIDDASTDKTPEVLEAIADPRVKILRHEANRGGAAARNTGIRAATGEFIAFLDSDDEWLPGKLTKQMRVMLQAPASVGVVYSGYNRVQLSGKLSHTPFLPKERREGDLFTLLLKRNFIFLQTAVMRRTCFDDCGYLDETLRRYHDWEFWLRIARKHHFLFVDERLCLIYTQRTCISSDHKHGGESLEFLLREYRDEIEKDKNLLGEYLYRIGKMLQEQGRHKEARRYFQDSLRARPGHSKCRFRLMRTLIGF